MCICATCPLPKELGDVLARYKRVMIPENNSGQLAALIRATYLIDTHSVTTKAACRSKPSILKTRSTST